MKLQRKITRLVLHQLLRKNLLLRNRKKRKVVRSHMSTRSISRCLLLVQFQPRSITNLDPSLWKKQSRRRSSLSLLSLLSVWSWRRVNITRFLHLLIGYILICLNKMRIADTHESSSDEWVSKDSWLITSNPWMINWRRWKMREGREVRATRHSESRSWFKRGMSIRSESRYIMR